MKQIKNLELFYPDIYSNLMKFLKHRKDVYCENFLEYFFKRTEEEQDKILYFMYLTFVNSVSYFSIFSDIDNFISIYRIAGLLNININQQCILSDKLNFYSKLIKINESQRFDYLNRVNKICKTIMNDKI